MELFIADVHNKLIYAVKYKLDDIISYAFLKIHLNPIYYPQYS